MKWSQFIKDDNKMNTILPTASKYSRRIKTEMTQLQIKSIEKAKMEISTSRLFHNASPSSVSSKGTKIKNIIKKYSYEQAVQNHTNKFSTSPLLQTQQYCLDQQDSLSILERFNKDFNNFIRIFLSKIEALVNNEPIRKQISNKILTASWDILKEYLQKYNNAQTTSIKNSSYRLNQNKCLPKQQISTLVLKFEENSKKDSFSQLQKSIEKACKLLQNDKKAPRFSRTSKLPTNSRIMLNQSKLFYDRRIFQSRKRSKDVLYNINKVLNS